MNKKTLLITGINGLIGDYFGQIPVIIELSKEFDVTIKLHPETEELFELLPKSLGIKKLENINQTFDSSIELDIHKAFSDAHKHNLYMTQAYYPQVNLPIPEKAPKAPLELGPLYGGVIYTGYPSFDIIFAPFARSLPEEQKWSQENWQKLADSLPNEDICVLGSKTDPINYIQGKNVICINGLPLKNAFKILGNSGLLVSVVTGTSHVAFHMGIDNIVLNSQLMTWGRTPSGVHIDKDIQKITVEEVIDKIKSIQ